MSDIIGHGGGKSGGGSHTHYEATDSLQSISYARVLDLVSEGEIEGPADGLKSVFLDETPLQNADGTFNFKDVTVDFRSGTQAQDYIAGFPDVENEIGIGVELRAVAPWVRSIGNTALSAVRITLGVPALSKADTTNGDILGYKIDYQIELSTDGGAYAVVLSSSFNGKTTSAYQRSARIDLPRATSGWALRVTRLTANANAVGIADTTTIISYTEVIDAKLRYPMSAIVGVQVDAKQFQSIPTRSYDMFGRIVQVPSNYDPKTRVYTGVWDGTFKPSWTNNPAWIFRDLVLSARYGLGDRITAAQVDKWALYQIARYCDELVPNGKGGTEPRFTCNLYLQNQKAAYAVLQDIASIFRGISYWGGGSIIASADMPLDPVYVYTAANVIGGKFSRVGSSKKTRYTVALVSWNDPDDFYRAKVEYVEDAEGIARYGIQQAPLTAFGCTSQSQAQRVGRWALATSRLETEAITFDVGMDGAIALPGQIVRIADPARMGRRNGGRVRAAVGRVVTLDKAPVINPGDALTCILPTGVSQTRTVSSVAGDAVTVSADWSALPPAQSVWSVDSSALIAPTFKILSITEKDALTYTITATQHEPGKFAFIENGVAIQPRPETSLDVSKQAAPASVAISARTISLQDVQKLVLVVSCPVTEGAVAYQGAYRFANGNWIDMPRQAEPTFEIVDVLAGNYTAKLSALNSIGVVSLETQSLTLTIAKNVNPKNAAVLLSSTSPAFHVAADGSHAPNAITIGATLVDLDGAVNFTAAGAALSNVTARGATINFADMTGTIALVTASIVSNGETISGSIYVNKVQDGATGNDGPAGQRFGNAELFQWSTVQPAAPTGTTTFTWSTLANASYTGSDGWSTVVPANPGGPTVKLYRASRAISAPATATSSSVSYAGATVAAITANGATGAAGVKAAPANAYRWGLGPAPTAAGTATFTWATASYDTPPSGWSAAEPAAPGQGYTLYKAVVNLVDASGAATTAIDWTTANIVGISYWGVNGTGGAGSNGNSAMIAYTIVDGLTLNSTPDTVTVSGQGRPSAGAWGSTRAWTDVPGVPTAGQALMQSNGIWNGTSTVWSLPYMSTFRVGSLSALSANFGHMTAGSFDINGRASIDENGHAIFSSFELVDLVSGQTILTAGGNLNANFAAAGTKNSDFTNGTLLIGGDNLAPNSSFENFSGGVATGYGVYTNDPSGEPATASIVTGRSGSGSAQQIAWSTGHYNTKGIYGPVCQGGWIPGKTYTVSFYARTTNLSSVGGCFLAWNVQPTMVELVNPNLSTSWQRYVIKVIWGATVEGGGTGYISAHYGAGSGNIQFDDLMVVEGDVIPAYSTSAKEAGTTSTWAGTSGTGKPQDNATVGAPAGTYVGSNLAQDLETLAGATAKANAAAVTAVNAAAIAAQAKADLAKTQAQAYADGIVTTEEARAIADATEKANAAQAASVAAAAVDATAKANVAATTANWSGVANNDGQRPANGATVGAPAGSYVGGTEAGLVASRALNGDAAYNSLGGINSAIADKLSKAAGNVMTGYIGLQSAGGIVAGNLTWGASGTVTAGQGSGITSRGLFGYNGTKYTFIIEASTGNAIFGGTLEAPNGSIGSIDLAASGCIKTANSAGWGFWPAAGAGSVAYFGPQGIQVGNYNDGRYLHIFATGEFYSPYLSMNSAGATFGGTLSAARIITNDNMAIDGAATVDIFSSGLPSPGNPGYTFVVSRPSKVIITATFGADNSAVILFTASAELQRTYGNAGQNGLIGRNLDPGTYYLTCGAGSVTFAHIMKVV